MRKLLPLMLLVPHLSVFVWAGIREFRAWRRIPSDERPSFVSYLGRASGPVDTVSPKRAAERHQASGRGSR